MDIRKAAIYELPMTGAALKYASGQRFATTRGMKSILVFTDEEPKLKARKLDEGGELNKREIAWALSATAEVLNESENVDSKKRLEDFLKRMEAELEKKLKQEGGVKNGE